MSFLFIVKTWIGTKLQLVVLRLSQLCELVRQFCSFHMHCLISLEKIVLNFSDGVLQLTTILINGVNVRLWHFLGLRGDVLKMFALPTDHFLIGFKRGQIRDFRGQRRRPLCIMVSSSRKKKRLLDSSTLATLLESIFCFLIVIPYTGMETAISMYSTCTSAFNFNKPHLPSVKLYW